MGATYIQMQRPRILVVDDEEPLTDLLAELLEDEGYAVDRAYNGEQAWRIVQAAPPDLMLTDVMMPKMSGPALVSAAREVVPAERLPVLLLSAGGQPRLEWDNVRFLPKPLQLDALLDEVHTLLGGRTALTERAA